MHVAQSQLFVTPWDCSMPGFPVLHHLREPTQTHILWVGDAIQPSHHLSSPSPPAFNLSQYQSLFKWVSFSHQVTKVLEFQLHNSSSNEHSVLISFRMDWLDLLAVQGTLKSLVHHHSSKASILLCLAFFIVQLSHPYMTTGKTIPLTRWTFVDLLIRFAILYERGSPCLKTMSKITDRRSTTKNIIITKKSGASLVAL